MEKVTLQFICKNHCYRTHVFSSYADAIAYLHKNSQPLGTTKIVINF